MPSPGGRPLPLQVRGLVFDALVWGPAPSAAGAVVLLLHGFPQTAASWDAVAGRLAAAGVTAVAPDQRGYSPGARPAGDDAYARAELVADVLAVIDELAGPDGAVHLAGHDWGAVVGWDVAARHPRRVLTWTAVSTPAQRALDDLMASGSPAGEAQRRQFGYILGFRRPGAAATLIADDAAALRSLFGSDVPAARVEQDLAVLGDVEAMDAALAWYRAMRRSDGADVPTVEVPTSFVWGSADLSFGRAAAEGTAAAVGADYRFVPLEGASHWLPDQHPDRVAEVILDRIGS